MLPLPSKTTRQELTVTPETTVASSGCHALCVSTTNEIQNHGQYFLLPTVPEPLCSRHLAVSQAGRNMTGKADIERLLSSTFLCPHSFILYQTLIKCLDPKLQKTVIDESPPIH